MRPRDDVVMRSVLAAAGPEQLQVRTAVSRKQGSPVLVRYASQLKGKSAKQGFRCEVSKARLPGIESKMSRLLCCSDRREER